MSASGVSANAGPPSYGGSVAADPNGLEEIFITRENLLIDLRRLGQLTSKTEEKTVWVEAVYEMENRGEEKNQKLVFAVGSENAADFQLWFDEVPLDGSGSKIEIVNDLSKLPETWQHPKQTPWHEDTFGGENSKLDYLPSSVKSMSFELKIPPGKHTLKAKYRSEATQFVDLSPLIVWQFAYILAPAREWAGFGSLDATVFVPEGWDTVTSPELKSEGGGVLRGTFDGIPADSIAISTRSILPWSYRLSQIGSLIFLFLVILPFPAWGHKLVRRKGYRFPRIWSWGIGFGISWGILFIVAGFLAIIGPAFTVPGSQASIYGEPLVMTFLLFIVLCTSPVLMIIGSILWINTAKSIREGQLI
ncbi:MAG: hypothetical protein R2747_09830 [Pyrinomonadaceae bacterium]